MIRKGIGAAVFAGKLHQLLLNLQASYKDIPV